MNRIEIEGEVFYEDEYGDLLSTSDPRSPEYDGTGHEGNEWWE